MRDLLLPRRGHGNGGVQNLGRVVALPGTLAVAHRRRAAVYRLHVRLDRQLYRARLALVRIPFRPASAGDAVPVVVRGYLRELFYPSFHARFAHPPVRRGAADVWAYLDLL